MQQVRLGDLTIRGLTLTDSLGRQAHAYIGIPFAEAPVGPLRFSNPVPKQIKAGTLYATVSGPMCLQDLGTRLDTAESAGFWFHNFFTQTGREYATDKMSEDCLYLNIFTPDKPATMRRPVLVWIHGGGFLTGGAYGYDGRVLANEADAVVVVIQYRLGLFGFFSTADAAGGNWGLKDQAMALKWVQGATGAVCEREREKE